MSLTVVFYAIGPGKCAHSDKECDSGYTVTIGDFKEVYLSERSFRSFVKMMLSTQPKPPATPSSAKPAANGQPQGATS